MKTWTNPMVEELDIECTANQPSAEVAVDDLINGVFTFGKRELPSSGSAKEIIYDANGQ